jgi:hypothetical protein
MNIYETAYFFSLNRQGSLGSMTLFPSQAWRMGERNDDESSIERPEQNRTHSLRFVERRGEGGGCYDDKLNTLQFR